MSDHVPTQGCDSLLCPDTLVVRPIFADVTLPAVPLRLSYAVEGLVGEKLICPAVEDLLPIILI
jgi:hypothetical protein